jgi:hypothetical protein
MPLNPAERTAFLAGPHVAALAVDGEDGRGPLNVPIWYNYSPGGEVEVMTGGDSHKARLIDVAGRLSLLVQRVSPTYRYVSVEGPVTHSAPTTHDEITRIAARYLSPEAVPGYVEGSDLGALVTFRMRPEHWLSADLGAM